jgi:hypothetical protein
MSSFEYDNEERLVMAVEEMVRAFHNLGKADASTPMGAIELLSKEIKCGAEGIASALHEIAEAILTID